MARQELLPARVLERINPVKGLWAIPTCTSVAESLIEMLYMARFYLWTPLHGLAILDEPLPANGNFWKPATPPNARLDRNLHRTKLGLR